MSGRHRPATLAFKGLANIERRARLHELAAQIAKMRVANSRDREALDRLVEEHRRIARELVSRAS